MTEVDMTTVVASLVVAGLGVYAFTQLGAVGDKDTREEQDTQKHAQLKDTSAGAVRDKGDGGVGPARKGRNKRKAKVAAADGAADDVELNGPGDAARGKCRGKDKGAGDVGGAGVLPGGFEAPGAPDASLAVSIQPATKATKKKKKKAGKTQGGDDEETGKVAQADAGTLQPESTKTKKKQKKKASKQAGGKDEEMGKEAAAAGDSTDADVSVSLSPPASGSTRADARVAPRPHDRVRVQPQREMLRSLSLDTDGSWTHVDRRGLNKVDGIGRRVEVDVTSSDLASTESYSPIVERVESVANDIRGTRGDLEKLTLAEKLVPRPEETSVDDMLEQPSFTTLARVMRVQPRADETPVPGFSWEDYGDVVEESVLVHDADEEDEGKWGIVKSRSRTRPTQTPATATTTPQATAAPETTMTKKQRQNARNRELAKTVKADAEAARLQGLAKHKRELERLRTIEQSQRGGGKQTSGGMHATVDDGGKLVWE